MIMSKMLANFKCYEKVQVKQVEIEGHVQPCDGDLAFVTTR